MPPISRKKQAQERQRSSSQEHLIKFLSHLGPPDSFKPLRPPMNGRVEGNRNKRAERHGRRASDNVSLRNHPGLINFYPADLFSPFPPLNVPSQGGRRSNLHWISPRGSRNVSCTGPYYFRIASLPANLPMSQCTDTELKRTLTGNSFR